MKNCDKNLEVVLLMVLLVGIGAMLVVVMERYTIQELKQQAIEQECANYNSVDGEFEWVRKD